MSQQMTYAQVYRSHDACVGGVCAGIAERYDFDPIVMRILAILLIAVTFGIGALVYIVLWMRLPVKPEPAAPYDVTPQGTDSLAGCAEGFDDVEGALAKEGDRSEIPLVPRLATAVVLMLLFLFVSMNVAPMVPGTRWWQFWPLGLLIAGLFLMVVPVRNRYEVAWHAAGIVVTSVSAMMLPMGLGVVSWSSIPYAFEHLWVIVAMGVALAAFGFVRGVNAFVIVGALVIAAFCLSVLIVYSVPGDINALFVHMPDGRSLRIAMSG